MEVRDGRRTDHEFDGVEVAGGVDISPSSLVSGRGRCQSRDASARKLWTAVTDLLVPRSPPSIAHLILQQLLQWCLKRLLPHRKHRLHLLLEPKILRPPRHPRQHLPPLRRHAAHHLCTCLEVEEPERRAGLEERVDLGLVAPRDLLEVDDEEGVGGGVVGEGDLGERAGFHRGAAGVGDGEDGRHRWAECGWACGEGGEEGGYAGAVWR